jgi:transcriptional regulator with XRE-family HTH domain
VGKMTKINEKDNISHDIKMIGLRLKSIRKSLNFGNSDKFALHYDIDRAQYGKYEAGSQDFRISSLIKILDKIGYSLSEFFNDDFDKLK